MTPAAAETGPVRELSRTRCIPVDLMMHLMYWNKLATHGSRLLQITVSRWTDEVCQELTYGHPQLLVS